MTRLRSNLTSRFVSLSSVVSYAFVVATQVSKGAAHLYVLRELPNVR